ncbi:hypothetical protein TWF694_008519 [Orbilia ellipsospora]|uniref:Uncharacterized protein n=1 Tax=Orbilia ellipsospora TaxID=2528407 RepID=A0AAV9XGB6_9PEZI
MKFTTIAFAAVAGLSSMVAAIPEVSGTITAGPVNTATAAGYDAGYSSTLSCINSCGAGNVYCQAQCQGLPTPDGAALNATHDCVAACPPGGSAAANAAWAKCQEACVSSYYYTASQSYSSYVMPTAAGFSSSGVPNVAAASVSSGAAAPSGTSAKTSGGASQTSNSTSPTQSPNAGAYVSTSMPMMGAIGLFFAALFL